MHQQSSNSKNSDARVSFQHLIRVSNTVCHSNPQGSAVFFEVLLVVETPELLGTVHGAEISNGHVTAWMLLHPH
jgi:hypothetical protein